MDHENETARQGGSTGYRTNWFAMTQKRRKLSAALKAKVAIMAIQGHKIIGVTI